MKHRHKLYVVKKYIKATSATHAIRLDKTTPVHDVWIDDKWAERDLPAAIGFGVDIPADEDE